MLRNILLFQCLLEIWTRITDTVFVLDPAQEFYEMAKSQHEVLEGMCKKMTSLYVATGKYFAFDIKKYAMEDFFSDLKHFITQFHVSQPFVFSVQFSVRPLQAKDQFWNENVVRLVTRYCSNFFVSLLLLTQEAANDLAKIRETEEKIRRAKEAAEKREREKREKMARKKALVDITAGEWKFPLMNELS